MVLDDILLPVLPRDKDIHIEDIVFDPIYYLDKYSDVRQECGSDRKKIRNHWDTKGIDEGRECSPVLDLAFLITRIPSKFQNRQLNFRKAYNMFIANFKGERPLMDPLELASSLMFNPKLYRERYPQLKRYTAKQLLLHYISVGRFNLLNAGE